MLIYSIHQREQDICGHHALTPYFCAHRNAYSVHHLLLEIVYMYACKGKKLYFTSNLILGTVQVLTVIFVIIIFNNNMVHSVQFYILYAHLKILHLKIRKLKDLQHQILSEDTLPVNLNF